MYTNKHVDKKKLDVDAQSSEYRKKQRSSVLQEQNE